jgi:adenosylhomocysteine nucleosidase
MNDVIHNSGVVTTRGSTTTIGQAAIGTGAHITNPLPADQPTPGPIGAHGIGVVAIKATEARAVVEEFGLTRERDKGQDFYRGEVESADGAVTLVAARALEPGQRSTMAAMMNLRQHSNPAVFVLVGIGGAINRGLDVGDVVVANRVIYYDLRRESADGVHRRGEERHAPAAITRAVNTFFDNYHEPARLESPDGSFRVLPGPIGSGDAVIMDAESKIRQYLLTYNEKTLAIDMEAGGLTQFCHEAAPPPPGWLVIRGISDLADRGKTYDRQPAAARDAAIALRHLIPYLPARI